MSGKSKVVYMTDPEAKFVSLVGRGANRTPFRIVKNQEEPSMKIIQRIVARKGTDVAAIQEAVGAEAASVLNLTNVQESGAFIQYEQHPLEAFKSDSLVVVPMTDDNSVLGICGELVEKNEGFVSKLLSRSNPRKGVEVPDSLSPISEETLKGDMSHIVWTELGALCNALGGVLEQSASEDSDKLSLCKALCENFLKSVETAVEVSKSEDFGPRPVEKSEAEAEAEEKEPEAPAGESDENLVSDDSQAEAPEPAKVDEAAIIEKATKAAAEAAKAAFEEALKPLQESLNSLSDTVQKMQKAPANVMESREDYGKRSQASKSVDPDNIFAGCFGKLR